MLNALFVLLSVSLSQAEGKGPCAADRAKFCAAETPGKGMVTCMKEHEAELSVGCKAHHEKMKTARHERREACKGDVDKFCGTVKKGGGAIMRCLKEHEAELSAECKKEREETKAIRKSAHGAK